VDQANLPIAGEQECLICLLFGSNSAYNIGYSILLQCWHQVEVDQANLPTVREQQCLQYWIFYSSNLRIVAIDTFCCEDAWLVASKKGRYNS
jgi:hypothetical protein